MLPQFLRYELPQNAIIHSLAFSAAHNLLAWTDSNGNLTRWPGAVPPSLPSPTKVANIAGISSSKRVDALTLFDDTAEAAGGDEGGDADVDLAAVLDENDDDWIIDDVGDGMKDTVDKDFGKSGLREMGNALQFICCKK